MRTRQRFALPRQFRLPGPPGRSVFKTVVTLLVLAAVATTTVAGLARLRTDTTRESFLPSGDRTLQGLQDAARSFGGDPIVVLAESKQPRELLGPDQLARLMALEGQLAHLPDAAVVYGPSTVLNQIAGSTQDLLATLSGRRDATRAAAEQQARATGASQERATAAGNAAVTEFDQRYGSLLVRGLPAGLPTLRNPGFVNTVVFDQNGAPRPQWHFVVPAPQAVAILIRPREGLDQAGTEKLVEAARSTVQRAGLKTDRLTVTGTPTVAADLAHQVGQEVPLLGGLALALIAACYFLVPWTPRRRHRLLPLAATLSATALTLAVFGWLGLPLSLGVVTFLPILVGIGSDFPAYLVRGAQRRRVLVASLASAAGFASLAVSPLPFVRDLGLALAAGVLLAVAIALGLRRWLVSEEPGSQPSPEKPQPAITTGKRILVLGLAGMAAVAGWAVLPGLNVQSSPDELAAGLPAVGAAQHAEDVLGSSGEVQILLRGNNVYTPESLAWMRRAEDTAILRYGNQLHPIVSMPDLMKFLGPSPNPEQMTAALQLLPPYLTGAVVRSDGKAAVISLGLELQDLGDQQRLLQGLQTALPPPPAGLHADVVGLPVAAARGYELVSGNRYLTNLIGIVAAGLVLIVGLSRRSDAFRALLAAGLATGWGLAGAWLLAIPLTPLTVALGSLTTATACEFTILLLGHAGRSSRKMWRTVGVAACAAALGYLALAASGLSMIREFGLMLAASVALSLLAAHVVVRLFPVDASASAQNVSPPATTRMEVTV